MTLDKKIKGTPDAWENGDLGRNDEHVRRSTPEREKSVEDSLDLQRQDFMQLIGLTLVDFLAQSPRISLDHKLRILSHALQGGSVRMDSLGVIRPLFKHEDRPLVKPAKRAKHCLQCGVLMKRKGIKFCSRACAQEAMRKPRKTCRVCGHKVEDIRAGYCSRACKNKAQFGQPRRKTISEQSSAG